MKRIIVDYNKLNTEILDLLVEKFPDGYDDNDIISFRNAKGEQKEDDNFNNDSMKDNVDFE